MFIWATIDHLDPKKIGSLDLHLNCKAAKAPPGFLSDTFELIVFLKKTPKHFRIFVSPAAKGGTPKLSR